MEANQVDVGLVIGALVATVYFLVELVKVVLFKKRRDEDKQSIKHCKFSHDHGDRLEKMKDLMIEEKAKMSSFVDRQDRVLDNIDEFTKEMTDFFRKMILLNEELRKTIQKRKNGSNGN